jgi:transposase
LTQAIEQEAEKSPEAQRLMTHPGVGSLTALAFVLIIGESGRLRQADRQLSRSVTHSVSVCRHFLEAPLLNNWRSCWVLLNLIR